MLLEIGYSDSRDRESDKKGELHWYESSLRACPCLIGHMVLAMQEPKCREMNEKRSLVYLADGSS